MVFIEVFMRDVLFDYRSLHLQIIHRDSTKEIRALLEQQTQPCNPPFQIDGSSGLQVENLPTVDVLGVYICQNLPVLRPVKRRYLDSASGSDKSPLKSHRQALRDNGFIWETELDELW